jgi:hypothetical protein
VAQIMPWDIRRIPCAICRRLAEAEPLLRRALAIDEASLGPEHPDVARDLNNLAQLLQATNRLAEAQPLSRRMLLILLAFTRDTGHPHPSLGPALSNYRALALALGMSTSEADMRLVSLGADVGMAPARWQPLFVELLGEFALKQGADG